jgi:hypothetical protein
VKVWRVVATSEGLSMCVFVGDEAQARLLCDRIVGMPLRMPVSGGGEYTIGTVMHAELVECER